jgi:Zn-dependent protease with chaperone function
MVDVPVATEQALAFYRSGNLLWIAQQAFSLLVPLVLLFSGFSAKLRALAQRVGRTWFFALTAYLLAYMLLVGLLRLPLDYYADYLRPRAYGLSIQSFDQWLHQAVLSLLIGTAAAVLFFWIPYLLLRKSPKRWWLYTAAASIPCMAFVMFVEPIAIDPLFHDFMPLADAQLEERITALAAQAGVHGSKIYEVAMRQETTAMNAYVTGFGESRRIVLWDTLVAGLTPDEAVFVVGHELGHYVLRHNVWFLVIFSFAAFFFLYLAYHAAEWLMRRFSRFFGFTTLADCASFPLLLFLLQAFSLAAAPLFNTLSQHMEREADRYGLDITRLNQAAATAFVRMQYQNLVNPSPGPLYLLWRSSHPALADRVRFCNTYRPEEQKAD